MTTARIITGTRTIKGKYIKGKHWWNNYWEEDKISDVLIIEYTENGKEKKASIEGINSSCRRKAVDFLLQKGFNASKAEIAKFMTVKIDHLVLFHN